MPLEVLGIEHLDLTVNDLQRVSAFLCKSS